MGVNTKKYIYLLKLGARQVSPKYIGFFNKQKSEDKILSLSPGVLRGKGETENRAWKYEARHLPKWQKSETVGWGGKPEANTVVQKKMLVKQGEYFWSPDGVVLGPWRSSCLIGCPTWIHILPVPPLTSFWLLLHLCLFMILCFWWFICTICYNPLMGPQPQMNYMMKFLVIQKIWAVCGQTGILSHQFYL